MKKLTLVAIATMMSLFCIAGNGILKREFYGKYEGTELIQFLLGQKNISDAEINLSASELKALYRRQIAKLFPSESLETVLNGSTEMDPDGNFSCYNMGFLTDKKGISYFHRSPYKGERILVYNGTVWASSWCWNPMDGSTVQVPAISTYTTPPPVVTTAGTTTINVYGSTASASVSGSGNSEVTVPTNGQQSGTYESMSSYPENYQQQGGCYNNGVWVAAIQGATRVAEALIYRNNNYSGNNYYGGNRGSRPTHNGGRSYSNTWPVGGSSGTPTHGGGGSSSGGPTHGGGGYSGGSSGGNYSNTWPTTGGGSSSGGPTHGGGGYSGGSSGSGPSHG